MVFMQTVYSTVIWGNSNWVCDKGVNLTNVRKSVMYNVWLCDDKRDLTFWTWLDICWVLDFLELALTYTWTWVNFLLGKAEAFIYKSPSYNNARRSDMLGGKLSQLNDKAREQKVQKRKQWRISQAVPGESGVTKNRTWFVMMGKN